ncbi:hypothetical protein [Longimicrobium sp.]|uniref:hypothetical protein n=1 Tax=Longimicrobium sp. TaxID=2029185 RepID=UPI002E3661B5|nr:hypothetical protein [Longimicrobium sp.]HEX6040856.1 hypothetical protein [Longimicrobium sp.]
MKKLSLKMDDLRVESFRTTPVLKERATVRANSGCEYTDIDNCTEYWSTCPSGPQDTDYFCPGSGDVSCNCSNEPETCAWPCRVSDMTDCHRC